MEPDRKREVLRSLIGKNVMFLEHSYSIPFLGILSLSSCGHSGLDFEVVNEDGDMVSFCNLDVDVFLKDERMGISRDTIYGQPYSGNCFQYKKGNEIKK